MLDKTWGQHAEYHKGPRRRSPLILKAPLGFYLFAGIRSSLLLRPWLASLSQAHFFEFYGVASLVQRLKFRGGLA